MYVLITVRPKTYFYIKIIWNISTFKTKKSFKNYPIFFRTMYRVRGAVVGGISCRSENIQALVKMAKISGGPPLCRP
jgi:hypothetical protein